MKPYGWQKAPWESDRLIEVPSRTRENDQGELEDVCMECAELFGYV